MKKYLLAFLLSGACMAGTLDKSDEGRYMVLKPTGEPSTSIMRFYLDGTQWRMDGEIAGKAYDNLCADSEPCRLRYSTKEEIEGYWDRLPERSELVEMSCIENIAFAFCRLWSPVVKEVPPFYVLFTNVEEQGLYTLTLQRLED